MKALKPTLIFFSFICMISTSLLAYAYGGGMKTEEMPRDEQESIIESARINVSYDEPEKRPIICFDVNKANLIAIATETNNNKCICVYSNDMVFQYRINFICNGAFGFEWNGNDIEIYFVRSHAVILVDKTGKIKNIRSFLECAENSDYYNYVLGATERSVNGIQYTLKTDSGKEPLGRFGSYPFLCVKNPGEDEIILYDVSEQKAQSDSLRNKVDALFVVFVLVIVGFTWIITYKQYKKKKAANEKLLQDMIRQANDQNKNQF